MNKKISKLSQCLVPRDHDEIKFKDKCTESNRTTRSLYADEFFAKCWWEKQSRTDVNTWIVHETDHENMRRTLECLDCSKQVIFFSYERAWNMVWRQMVMYVHAYVYWFWIYLPFCLFLWRYSHHHPTKIITLCNIGWLTTFLNFFSN